MLTIPEGRDVGMRRSWERMKNLEGKLRAGMTRMVVKPLDFISKGRRGFAQPAVKCRGPEYLRII